LERKQTKLEEKPLVSIVMVNYRTLKQSKLCLRSLRCFTRSSHEVIVIDNRSEDESFEYLQTLRWISLHVNRAPKATHRNALDLAISKSRGHWILAIHSDTFVRREGWLEALLKYTSEDTRLLATADRVIMPMRTPWDQLHLWWTRRKRAKRWQKKSRDPKLISHCTLLHRSLFDSHGLLFDSPKYIAGEFSDCGEAIQRYCEEKSLGLRWIGREELAPLLWHFEAATLNLVTGRALPWKRRRRARLFYQRPEILTLLARDDLDE
jgi:glycosyltransferase involved in cell wall biosynthesis